MEHKIHINWLGAAIALAVGITVSIVASTALAARSFDKRIDQIEATDQEVSVKGSARARVRSDIATWRIDVTGEQPTLAEAFGTLEEGTQRLEAFLVDKGFDDAEVNRSAISTMTHYIRDKEGRATRDIDAYTLTRSFTVTTSDVAKVARAAGDVTELLRDNIRLTSGSPQYTYSGLPDVKVDIIAQASGDARARAEAIAREAGAQVSEVRTVRQGVMQVTRPDSTDVSSYGIYDTSTIDKDVSIVMTITFGLQ